MMNGINVLHQYEAGGMPFGGLAVMAFITVALLVLCLWNVICHMRKKPTFMSKRDIYISMGVSVLIGAVMFWSSTWKPHTEYKVTIDKSVSYIEFVEQYEVVAQEGSIYTIREVKGE